jgi:hypothetical protein
MRALAPGITSSPTSAPRGSPKLHFTRCKSPKTSTHLAKGHYRFEVRAVGPGGTDKTPAKRMFTITR